MSTKFMEEVSRNTTFTGDEVDAVSERYSITLITTGTFNIDVKLQTNNAPSNIDGWTDLEGSSLAAITAGPIQFDISVGKHKLVRPVITVNSGTLDTIDGYINNGY